MTAPVFVLGNGNGNKAVDIAKKNLHTLRPVENILQSDLRTESRRLRILAEVLNAREEADGEFLFTTLADVQESVAEAAASLEKIEESLSAIVVRDTWKLNRDELVKAGICEPAEVAV